MQLLGLVIGIACVIVDKVMDGLIEWHRQRRGHATGKRTEYHP